MILTFRASIPAATPADTPFTIALTPQARAIKEVSVWSPSANMAINKSGYRLFDYGSSKMFIPDSGSNDNAIITASGESGWAPIPPTPLRVDMSDQVIEGPPYRLTFHFYNTDAALILVAGFVVVHEPFAQIEPAMLYNILTAKNPPITDVSPSTKTDISAVNDKDRFKTKKIPVKLPGKS